MARRRPINISGLEFTRCEKCISGTVVAIVSDHTFKSLICFYCFSFLSVSLSAFVSALFFPLSFKFASLSVSVPSSLFLYPFLCLLSPSLSFNFSPSQHIQEHRVGSQ